MLQHHNRRRLTLLLGNNSPPQHAQAAGCSNSNMPLHALCRKMHTVQNGEQLATTKATNTTVTLLPRTPHYTTPRHACCHTCANAS